MTLMMVLRYLGVMFYMHTFISIKIFFYFFLNIYIIGESISDSIKKLIELMEQIFDEYYSIVQVDKYYI